MVSATSLNAIRSDWRMILLIKLLQKENSYFGSCFSFIAKDGAHMNHNQGTERYGTHRGAFEKNKKIVFATQEVCGICGKPVDFSLKYPHPLSACIDHIIPLAKGGHPSDLNNLQLTHWCCNRQKSDKLIEARGFVNKQAESLSNRILPQSCDWTKYVG